MKLLDYNKYEFDSISEEEQMIFGPSIRRIKAEMMLIPFLVIFTGIFIIILALSLSPHKFIYIFPFISAGVITTAAGTVLIKIWNNTFSEPSGILNGKIIKSSNFSTAVSVYNRNGDTFIIEIPAKSLYGKPGDEIAILEYGLRYHRPVKKNYNYE